MRLNIMIPRTYQRRVVESAVKALKNHKNSLLIAATGAGKTIIMGFLGGKFKCQQLVLQHSDELVLQNSKKYADINPKKEIGIVNASKKRWGQTTFAMVQTLVRNLDTIPKGIGLVVIDEAHHVCADTYIQIIDAVKKKNPKVKVFGLTATPERGDSKSLRKVFDNVCDHITIRELVELGHLVRPVAHVIDAGSTTHQKLDALPNTGGNYADQGDVADILDTVNINQIVVDKWKELSGNRRTIVFCATVEHAEHVAAAYRENGVTAECVHGGMSKRERKGILSDFDNGRIQVLTNVFILTEGYDSQPVSCVVLLRQCSGKGPLIQMAGRGLRTVNKKEYPGIIKNDCHIIDFGTSIATHGNLDQSGELAKETLRQGGKDFELPTKTCPTEFNAGSNYIFPDPSGKKGCGAELPIQTVTCPMCGFKFARIVSDEYISDVKFTIVDVLNSSPFSYTDLYKNEIVLFAQGFEAWTCVVSTDGGFNWKSVGGFIERGRNEVELLAETPNRIQALAASDDWMRTYENDKNAKKTSKWMQEPATRKQVDALNQHCGLRIKYSNLNYSLTKYSAACHYNFQKRLFRIEKAIGVNRNA